MRRARRLRRRDAIVVLVAVVVVGWIVTWPMRDLWSMQAMADRAAELPFVAQAEAIDGDSVDEVYIELRRDAQDADARRVYCEVVIPSGWVHVTFVSRGREYWREPIDCSDPDDIPAALAG